MDKSRLEKLREENRRVMKKKKWESNVLFKECLQNLRYVRIIEEDTENQRVLDFIYKERWGFAGIDKGSCAAVKLNADTYYYVAWDNAELSVVQSRGENILECLEDVFAVSFETYLLSSDLAEIIHSDDRGRITIERRNG